MFENRFYTDEDCSFVDFDGERTAIERFVRDNWNKGNPHRSPFQRDLDNLVFSGAFRRLQGKTQVRKTGPNCFSRTRLSHSIEVARIARSLLGRLHHEVGEPTADFVDLDLVEFACFAHDIGNPPFGHSGERELNRLMQKHGGFEGNAQFLRIVTEIAWTNGGIKPTKAAIDSILKYKKTWSVMEERPDKRSKFLYDYQETLIEQLGLEPNRTIECQIMDLADDIGNALIDFTDGVRSSIITSETVKFWAAEWGNGSDEFAVDDILGAFKAGVMQKFATVRVGHCVKHLSLLGEISRKSLSIGLLEPYSSFIKTVRKINSSLLFKDPEIRGNDNAGAFKIRTLFEVFVRHYCERSSSRLLETEIIPPDWHARLENLSRDGEKLRCIADYISGMTDEYADMMFEKAVHTAL